MRESVQFRDGRGEIGCGDGILFTGIGVEIVGIRWLAGSETIFVVARAKGQAIGGSTTGIVGKNEMVGR